MNGGIVVRVLGPLEVVKDGTVHVLGSRQSRALLGTRVIATGRVVSAQRLEAALWGDSPPPSARASLHSHVSRLRHLLGPALIEREDHSYRLLLTRRQIDALCFEDLLTEAEQRRDDPDQCWGLCRQALGLWRGEPFGDLGDEPSFRLCQRFPSTACAWPRSNWRWSASSTSAGRSRQPPSWRASSRNIPTGSVSGSS